MAMPGGSETEQGHPPAMGAPGSPPEAPVTGRQPRGDRDPSILAAVLAGPQDIDGVVDTMTEFGERIRGERGERDGVLCFNRLYLAVTCGVRRALGRRRFFKQPEQMAKLDVGFAELYFAALDADAAGTAVPRCWEPLFRHRDDPAISSLQFALGGMNAHINHDLPIALLRDWERRGGRPAREEPAYADFCKINKILQAEERREREELRSRLLDDLARFDRIDERLAIWSVEAARAEAWATADCLWDLRHHTEPETLLSGALDHLVGFAGDALLTPIR